MAVKHVLVDNGALGKIAKEQLAGSFPVWQTSLVNPDFAAYAELTGATGLAVRRTAELDQAMAALFAAEGPALLHVHADPELL
jgi:thiamine pyrophosphate-dependent acetolactate synthase large subunit-like protein